MRIRTLAIACAAIALASAAAVADEYSEVYGYMYDQARTMAARQGIVLQVVDKDDSASAPLLARILADLLKMQPSIKDRNDRATLAETVGTICAALGEFRYVEAADDVYRVIEEVSDVQARIEAIVALGKMRATKYVERLALMLTSLNGKPTANRSEGERIAFACIVALEKMGDPKGYAPIFFAMNSWYSDRVRDQAKASLAAIVEDPTDPITEIIRTATPSLKIMAFRTELESKAPDSRKLGVARYLLATLNEYPARDRTEALVTSEGRVLAIRSILALGGRDASDVELYKRAYQVGPYDEKLAAISALGENGTEAAAKALNEILTTLNDQKASGSTNQELERTAMAVIAAMAKNGNSASMPSLLAVMTNELWSFSVRDAAEKAISGLK
jgi:HEAT repeat protein